MGHDTMAEQDWRHLKPEIAHIAHARLQFETRQFFSSFQISTVSPPYFSHILFCVCSFFLRPVNEEDAPYVSTHCVSGGVEHDACIMRFYLYLVATSLQVLHPRCYRRPVYDAVNHLTEYAP